MRTIDMRRSRYEDGGAFKGHPYAFDDASSEPMPKQQKPALPLKEENKQLGVGVAKDFKQDIKAIANKDIVKDTMSAAKTNMNAVLIGGVIGIVYSYATKRSAIIGALMGGVLGGATAYGYKKFIKK